MPWATVANCVQVVTPPPERETAVQASEEVAMAAITSRPFVGAKLPVVPPSEPLLKLSTPRLTTESAI